MQPARQIRCYSLLFYFETVKLLNIVRFAYRKHQKQRNSQANNFDFDMEPSRNIFSIGYHCKIQSEVSDLLEKSTEVRALPRVGKNWGIIFDFYLEKLQLCLQEQNIKLCQCVNISTAGFQTQLSQTANIHVDN